MSAGKEDRKRLYRDPRRGKIFGVCAGLAEYFGLETWVVRVIAISLCVFLWGSPVIVAYIIAALVMEKKPDPASAAKAGVSLAEEIDALAAEDDAGPAPRGEQGDMKVQQVWRSGTGGRQRLVDLEDIFSGMEHRVQHMEAFVTSGKYDLEKEFASIKD